MKFSKFVEHVTKTIREHPESSDYEVIYSIDEEGNGYKRVFYHPTLMCYDKNDEMVKPGENNAVCIN